MTSQTLSSCKYQLSPNSTSQANDFQSGDSCHPMLPYLAQGANSSLEDGAVLGQLLGQMTDKAQLPRILRLYESLRKSRGEAIVRETFKQVSLDTFPPIEWLSSREFHV
jgi:salicylate hydroxylase